MTAAEVVTPWDAWFAWLERERPARLYELPLADNEPADDTRKGNQAMNETASAYVDLADCYMALPAGDRFEVVREIRQGERCRHGFPDGGEGCAACDDDLDWANGWHRDHEKAMTQSFEQAWRCTACGFEQITSRLIPPDYECSRCHHMGAVLVAEAT